MDNAIGIAVLGLVMALIGLISIIVYDARIDSNAEIYHSKICSLAQEGSVPFIMGKDSPTRDGPWGCVSGSAILVVE